MSKNKTVFVLFLALTTLLGNAANACTTGTVNGTIKSRQTQQGIPMVACVVDTPVTKDLCPAGYYFSKDAPVYNWSAMTCSVKYYCCSAPASNKSQSSHIENLLDLTD